MLLNLDNGDSREIVETCFRTHKTLINPLIDWDDEFLWWYISHEEININPQYACGQCRIGCIGCPMAGNERYAQFAKYPKYKKLYIASFGRMLMERERRGLENRSQWKSAQCVFDWWMEDENLDGQYSMNFNGIELVGFKEKGV